MDKLDLILEKMGIDTLSNVEILNSIPDGGQELSKEELESYLRYDMDSKAIKLYGSDDKPILYIKSNSGSQKLFNRFWGSSDYKFHFLWCRTLEGKFSDGTGNRYVLVPAKGEVLEHIFPVPNGNKELKPCQNCISILNKKWQISCNINTFKLPEVLEKYEPQYKKIPASEFLVPRKNGYSTNWNKTSRDYRQRKKWRCESCNVNCSNHQYLLDTHHIDGNTQHDIDNNLKALCKLCHSSMPNHQHMKPTENDKQIIQTLMRQ